MNNGQKSLSINETFIIEGENDGTMSACTGFFTNALVSCTGNTQILLGNNLIEANSAFSATTFYGDGSNLTGISTENTYVTGVTFSDNFLTLYRNDGAIFGAIIDNFTSLTVNGPVSATTFYGDGSNLSGITQNLQQVTDVNNTTTNSLIVSNSGNSSTLSTGDLTIIDSFGNYSQLGTQGIGFVNQVGNVYGSISVATDLGTNFNGMYMQVTDAVGGVSDISVRLSDEYFTVPIPIGNIVNNFKIPYKISGDYTLATLEDLVTIIGGSYSDGVTTFTNSTGGTFNVDGPSNYNAGIILGAENWVNNGDGSINLPEIKVALFDNSDNLELLKIYTVASGTTGIGGIPSLANNDTNYIIVEYNGGSPIYNVLDNDGTVNSSDVVLYMIVYRANNFVHTLEFGNMGAGLPNKLNTRLISTDRFARESGCALGLSGSTGVVTLSSGVVWNGPYRQIVTAVNSQDDVFFKSFHSGGTWTYVTTGDTINNSFYDDGTNLVSATAGKYLVNWYFRGQEVNDHLYELISYGQYDTVQLAEASPEPNLPELITSHAFLVGRIIVAVSATTGITQSAFNTVFQPSGAPVLHNDLAGIQGGVAGEYYHLDSNKYNNLALTNTNNNFSVGQGFNAGLTATTISATTYQNLPLDIRVTGGTYSNGTTTYRNNTGGTFTVTGLTTPFTGGTVTGATRFTNGLTANTISATTYQNLPLDIRVTGGTYQPSIGLTTYRNNTGGTFNIAGYFKPSDDIYVSAGTVTHGPSTNNNNLTLQRNNTSDVIINDLVNIVSVSRSEMNNIINDIKVIRGKTYKISNCDSSLYNNGTDSGNNPIYTTVYLMGLENDKISETGVGVFYTPKYKELPIFVNGSSYSKNEKVIWGGYVWICETAGTYNSVNLFNLDPVGFSVIYPFDKSNELNTELYNTNYDDIIYDIQANRIIYRNEQNTNIVSTTVDNINYWLSEIGHNPIKVFQWGNIYERGGRGIGHQIMINSYNENINFNGVYQKDFYFEGLSYMRNNNVDDSSFQQDFYFKNKSYQQNIVLTRESYQNSIRLTDNSFLNNITIDNLSGQSFIELDNQSYFTNIDLYNKNTYQQNLKFYNNSYQDSIIFGEGCYQKNFVFNNESYQESVDLVYNGKLAQQENFNFTNKSRQIGTYLDSTIQQNFNFNNGVQNNISTNKGQSKINIDNGEQSNGVLTDAQNNITIKGYILDWSVYPTTSPQDDLFFINNLPSKVTTTLIGKDNNQLIEVSNLYYDGTKWIADAISATTISATAISATTYNGYIPASKDDSIINAIIFG